MNLIIDELLRSHDRIEGLQPIFIFGSETIFCSFTVFRVIQPLAGKTNGSKSLLQFRFQPALPILPGMTSGHGPKCKDNEEFNSRSTAMKAGPVSRIVMMMVGFRAAVLKGPTSSVCWPIVKPPVDWVAVYKVETMSRALLDFARIIDLYDQHDVSFVSATQQFNTTSSMGRPTLNILLSLAQFEWEIISEPKRDKMSTARRKGEWIGGGRFRDTMWTPPGG